MSRKRNAPPASGPDPLSILLELRSELAPEVSEELVADVYRAEVEGLETEATRAQIKATVRVRIEQETGIS